MADDKKISDLPVATTPSGTELMEIVQGGVNKQLAIDDLPGGAPAFADITGAPYDNTALAGEFRKTRTVTGADVIVQTDDNSLIIFNSGAPFDFTLDSLTSATTEKTKASFLNIGAGAVTFVNGAGVTLTGGPTLAAAVGTSYPTAFVIYLSSTTPRLVVGSTGGGAVDSVNGQTGVVVLDATDVGSDVAGAAAAVDADLDAHIADTTAAHAATAISFTPAGTISSTTVQAAIEEVAAESGASPWTDTTSGTVERSTQAEAEAVFTQVLAAAVGSLSASRTGSETGLYYLLTKLWEQIDPTSVAVSLVSTTVTLDCATRRSRKWYTSTAHSANFTLTKTNKTVIEYGHYVFSATGTITIQLDSDDRMPDDTPGWNFGAKTLQLVTGGTGLIYSLAFTKVGSIFQVTISTKATA